MFEPDLGAESGWVEDRASGGWDEALFGLVMGNHGLHGIHGSWGTGLGAVALMGF